jgi:hypothetical protein
MCRSQSFWFSQIFCCPSVPCCACVEVLGAVDDRLGGFVEEDETHPANWQRSMVSGSRRPRALYLLTLVPLSPSCCLYLVLSSSRVPPCRAMSLAIVRSPSRCAAAVSCCRRLVLPRLCCVRLALAVSISCYLSRPVLSLSPSCCLDLVWCVWQLAYVCRCSAGCVSSVSTRTSYAEVRMFVSPRGRGLSM